LTHPESAVHAISHNSRLRSRISLDKQQTMLSTGIYQVQRKKIWQTLVH